MVENYYNDTYKFENDKTPGLNIAFGITRYDNVAEPIDDLDYGEVVGVIK